MSTQKSVRRGQRFGVAATGISKGSAVFGKERTKAGAVGERALFQALDTNSLTRGYDIWSSLKVPNYERADVDIVLSSGNRVVLLDAKMWKAKFHYWSIFGTPMQNFSPMRDDRGEIRHLSKNMDNATYQFGQLLPQTSIMPLVVFLPTKAGTPLSVRFLKFPGGIRSVQLNDSIRQVHKFLGDPKPTDSKVRAVLSKHLKK